jgi:hypothetical protein
MGITVISAYTLLIARLFSSTYTASAGYFESNKCRQQIPPSAVTAVRKYCPPQLLPCAAPFLLPHPRSLSNLDDYAFSFLIFGGIEERLNTIYA